MSEMSVGIRDLKTRLSEYMRQVKAGRTIVITELGRPVGRIVPATLSLNDRLQAMAWAGSIAWSGKPLGPVRPVARARGERTVADLLIENRE
jgi:prevent-host-death family protein